MILWNVLYPQTSTAFGIWNNLWDNDMVMILWNVLYPPDTNSFWNLKLSWHHGTIMILLNVVYHVVYVEWPGDGGGVSPVTGGGLGGDEQSFHTAAVCRVPFPGAGPSRHRDTLRSAQTQTLPVHRLQLQQKYVVCFIVSLVNSSANKMKFK